MEFETGMGTGNGLAHFKAISFNTTFAMTNGVDTHEFL